LACFPLADRLIALAPVFLGGMVWKRQINKGQKSEFAQVAGCDVEIFDLRRDTYAYDSSCAGKNHVETGWDECCNWLKSLGRVELI
jgi:hypothetical protein